MKPKPKFSIIIPAYNVADYIETCLNSVFSQNFQDYEIIVVDDGSTDGSYYIIRQFVKDEPRLRMFRQVNSGLSAARNLGISKASGEYLIMLDGDDFLEPDALQKIAAALSASNSPDILRYQVQDFYEDGHKVPHNEPYFSLTTGVKSFPRLAAYHYTENAWAYVYRTYFFRRHGFKYAEGRLAEDFGLTPLIIAKAESILSIDAICYNYRQRAGSIMHDAKKLRARVKDSFAQLVPMVKELSQIPGAKPIAHYYIVSFLSLAATLPYKDFVVYYRHAKEAGLFRYVHATSLKNIPRSTILKLSPRLYHLLLNL